MLLTSCRRFLYFQVMKAPYGIVLLLIFAIGMLSGCMINSFTDQSITIQPELQVQKLVKISNDKKVSLRVVDDRAQTFLGTKNAGDFGEGAKISVANDVAVAVESDLRRALAEIGYKVIETSDDAPELEVRIRALSYEAYRGFWSGGVTIESSVNAIVWKQGMRLLEKRFIQSDDYRAAHALGGKSSSWNVQHVNLSLSNVLLKMLNDLQLKEALLDSK
jgi:hypothetical protein